MLNQDCMTSPRLRRSGDLAVLIDAAEGESARLASVIRQTARTRGIPVVDVVGGARSVLVSVTTPADLACLADLLTSLDSASLPEEPQAPLVELEVRYDGPDLDDVACCCGLSVDEVIAMHSSVTYRAAFCGFAPGFLYLTGLPERLRLPRRESPRQHVPAGSVAIADGYTAVYPRRSPGGWHLIGTTDAVLWDAERSPAALIAPGATVRFRALGGR